MKTFLFIFLQIVLVACFLYAIFDFPQLSSDSSSFEKEFESKAVFRGQSQQQTSSKEDNPSTPGSKDPSQESPNESTKEPTNENNPSNPQKPSHEESNIPPKEPINNDPQKPSQEESSIPPKEPSSEPEENKPTESTESSETGSKGEEEKDSSLKPFPRGRLDPKTRCQRKDHRQELLCKISGKGCVRYSPTQELAHLWLICAIYSPNRTKTRLLYEFHQNFIGYIKLFGANTQAIEVVFPGQDFIVTKPNNQPYELQYKADWVFNMRENLVNVGSKHLPSDWEYIAWIDANVFWDDNRYWFEDLIVELGRNNVVQVLESNTFTTEYNQTRSSLEGVAKAWIRVNHTTANLPPTRQCGMAWATKRSVFEAMGGVLDVCIGTLCDLYNNHAYFGEVGTEQCMNPNYANAVRSWQEKAMKVIQQKVGYVKGNIIHWEHCLARDGCMTSTYYLMTNAMSMHNYNPQSDLSRDSEGRLQFKSNLGLAQSLWTLYGGDPK